MFLQEKSWQYGVQGDIMLGDSEKSSRLKSKTSWRLIFSSLLLLESRVSCVAVIEFECSDSLECVTYWRET